MAAAPKQYRRLWSVTLAKRQSASLDFSKLEVNEKKTNKKADSFFKICYSQLFLLGQHCSCLTRFATAASILASASSVNVNKSVANPLQLFHVGLAGISLDQFPLALVLLNITIAQQISNLNRNLHSVVSHRPHRHKIQKMHFL